MLTWVRWQQLILMQRIQTSEGCVVHRVQCSVRWVHQLCPQCVWCTNHVQHGWCVCCTVVCRAGTLLMSIKASEHHFLCTPHRAPQSPVSPHVCQQWWRCIWVAEII